MKYARKKRIVVDTNVLISAVFFKGKPNVILEAWRAGSLEIILSEEMLHEYSEVLKRLSEKYPTIDASGILSVFATGCKIVEPVVIGEQVCADPDIEQYLSEQSNAAERCQGLSKGMTSADSERQIEFSTGLWCDLIK